MKLLFLLLPLAQLLAATAEIGAFRQHIGRRRRNGKRFQSSTPTTTASDQNKANNKDGSSLLSFALPTMTVTLTCQFYIQPLNHFDLPRNASGTYQQRFCVGRQFVIDEDDDDDDTESTSRPPPVFFYTGNESPLEQYIQHTGLMWEMARDFHALVVFAEHRYEGASIPDLSFCQDGPSVDQPKQQQHKQERHPCMAYSSSVQALADYATLIRDAPWQQQQQQPQKQRAPVICFGGSYGGMLAAWMRMRYPQWVAGAIAASAPIWGFPMLRQAAEAQQDPEAPTKEQAHPQQGGKDQPEPRAMLKAPTTNENMDGAYAVLLHALSQPYPPNFTNPVIPRNCCPLNMVASFPLIQILGQAPEGLDFLTRTFDLCEPLTLSSVGDLITWLQTPWFDLAEGSFPYPSSYIPYALTHLNVTLPAWPLQAACWKTGLVRDYGLRIVNGSLESVQYTMGLRYVHHDDDSHNENTDQDNNNKPYEYNYTFDVDWDQVGNSSKPVWDWITLAPVSDLLQSLRRAVSIWYNMTHTATCFNISQAAPNMMMTAETAASDREKQEQEGEESSKHAESAPLAASERSLRAAAAGEKETTGALVNEGCPCQACRERLTTGSWPSLCCNEDMNLIITYVSGTGRDFFWPPTVPRGIETTYSDYVNYYTENGTNTHGMDDPFCDDPMGVYGYPDHADPWSNWLDLQYGSYEVLETSSNIVFSNGLLDPWSAAGVYMREGNSSSSRFTTHRVTRGLTWQKGPNGLAALLLDHGGHHVDLMFSDAVNDPPAFAAARNIERRYVKSWINEFWNSSSSNNNHDQCRS